MVDHNEVLGACSSCHNDVIAMGKDLDHLVTSSECDSCHMTAAWLPATGFDHTGITSGCSSCHDNVTEPGKDPDHILSTNLCENCHTSVAWSPVFTVDHNEVLGSCGSCHDGVAATGKPGGHFVVTTPSIDCDSCHSSVSWLPDFYTHTGAYPGDHRDNPTCTACHTSTSEMIPWIFPAYQPDCAGCHEDEWEDGPHLGATVGELRDCAGACHEGPGEHSVWEEEF